MGKEALIIPEQQRVIYQRGFFDVIGTISGIEFSLDGIPFFRDRNELFYPRSENSQSRVLISIKDNLNRINFLLKRKSLVHAFGDSSISVSYKKKHTYYDDFGNLCYDSNYSVKQSIINLGGMEIISLTEMPLYEFYQACEEFRRPRQELENLAHLMKK